MTRIEGGGEQWTGSSLQVEQGTLDVRSVLPTLTLITHKCYKPWHHTLRVFSPEPSSQVARVLERLRWEGWESQVAESVCLTQGGGGAANTNTLSQFATWTLTRLQNTNQTMEWLSERANSGRLLLVYQMSRYWWEKWKKSPPMNSVHAHILLSETADDPNPLLNTKENQNIDKDNKTIM